MKKILIIPWMIALILFYSVFLDKVKADTYYSGMWQNLYQDSNKTQQYAYTNLYAYRTIFTTTGQDVANNDYFLGTSITRNSHFDHVYIPFMLLGETYSTATTTLNEYICSYQSTTSNGTTYYYPQSCGYQINSSNGSGTITVPVEVNFKFSIYLRDSNGIDTMCIIKEGYADCALQYDITYTYVRVVYNYNNSNVGQNLRFGINRMLQLYNSDGNAITNSINQQTQQQQEQFNQDHTYDNTPSKDINGTNELNDYSSQEDQLMNSLDFNMTVMDDITINPQASAYIWNIADRLRGINGKIILLMTSILGLGIIKMVLNR